jgi:hypothetical protein
VAAQGDGKVGQTRVAGLIDADTSVVAEQTLTMVVLSPLALPPTPTANLQPLVTIERADAPSAAGVYAVVTALTAGGPFEASATIEFHLGTFADDSDFRFSIDWIHTTTA